MYASLGMDNVHKIVNTLLLYRLERGDL